MTKKLKKREMVWRRNDDVTVCKWKDKRDVITILNILNWVEMVEVRNRKGKVMIKPNIVRDYNAGMSGVDRSDQMLSYYSALCRTIRWPKKLALHFFEMMIHNAYLLYCQESGSKKRSLSFREQLVLYLLKGKIPSEPTAKRQKMDLQYNPALFGISSSNREEITINQAVPCRVYTKNKKRKETRYFFAASEDHPPLCVVECFKAYHLNA